MEVLGGPLLVVSSLLVVAGVLKLRAPDLAASALSAVRLRGGAAAVRLIALVEVAIGGLGVLFGGRAAASAVAIVYIGFAAFVAVALAKGVNALACGCFGRSDSPLGPMHLVLNLAGAAIGVAAAVWPVSGITGITQDPAQGVVVALAAVVAAYLAYLAFAVLPMTASMVRSPDKSAEATAPPSLEQRWVVDSADLLDRRLNRRSFITRAAMVGTALSVAPLDFILRPVTAYAAICSCAGTSCSCGALCCDGYTDFCCSIYGSNTCPPGSIAAGWWKADGSGLCDNGSPQPRYYIDCNAECGQNFTCQCGLGSCDHRKTACTNFRYGQCNADTGCVGAIVCRVVTCTPPWLWDPSCGTSSATDNFTRFHNAACLGHSGPIGGIVLAGDWNGDGITTPIVFAKGTWYLFDENGSVLHFGFGDPGDIPVVGDWDGSGVDSIGVFRNGTWYLRNGNGPGPADTVFEFGDPGDIPVVGDWDGSGSDSVGVFREGVWHLRNANSPGSAAWVFGFGDKGDVPIVGDWNGDGIASVGVFRRGQWFIRNQNSAGPADLSFFYGDVTDHPVVGDWLGSGVAGPGVVRPDSVLVRYELSTGSAQNAISLVVTTL
ncbi:MAG: hypothetical protein OEM22_05055 [Acidimicrobiia bacterium]|nr:hypothetical protein [Acidimicrobiia bacterium]MDH3471005.1 hypothetical protein [Acidimicrobiia bacterium]